MRQPAIFAASSATAAGSPPDRHSLTGLRKRRKLYDKLATATISAGGMGVLVAILLIFFYLLYEVVPLFQSASIDHRASYPVERIAAADNEPLYLAVEEQAEIGLRLDRSGHAVFFDTAKGSAVTEFQLPVPDGVRVSSFGIDSEQSQRFVLGLENGSVLVTGHDYRISYPDGERLITPGIDEPGLYELAAAPLTAVAMRDTESALMVVGSTGDGLYVRVWDKEEDFMSEQITLKEREIRLPDVVIGVEHMLIGPTMDWLYLADSRGNFTVVDIEAGEVIDRGRFFDGAAALTEMEFLLGGLSLLVSSESGRVEQWFMVRTEGGLSELRRVRHFDAGDADAAIVDMAMEHRRKGFVSVSADRRLQIWHSTSGRLLLDKKIAEHAVNEIALAPRADAVLLETADGQLHFWEVHNEHPEVSWAALWAPTWYENYEEPEFVWQSSAANNDFEPKFSLTPLAFGTLKAAFYAMLLGAPLAICGAIYTAFFMAPALRRKVKPLIELMEALPTVILGFLAGLWLAPFVEKHLPGVFSVLVLMPMGVLLFAWLWNRIPLGLRSRVPDGWQPVLLIPVVVLITVLCFELSQPLERAFFAGDMRTWLTSEMGISFDQRNALVVGIAMGFAVIPTIFSIAEDAIFSVPKHLSYGSLALGATSWQTLMGVVMPTASPGIFSALMIGMGRAVGETMIVLMATGNTPIMDANIFEGMRTLAANIAVEIGETEVDSTHYRVLFLAAFVLFAFTFVVNTAAELVRQRLRRRYGAI